MLRGVSRVVRGIPIVSYRKQNCIIFKNPKTDFILIMTHFVKRGHLLFVKVLKSYKLTD